MKSIFEKILNKDIPGEILYENEKIFVIVDINPNELGHVLIIPKELKKNIFEENDETIIELFKISKKIKTVYEEKLNAKGFKVTFNVNEAGGQVIFHTHLHLIPFYDEKQNSKTLSSKQIEEIKILLSK